MINIEQKAKQLLDGQKWVKLEGIWDYKANYNGHKALFTRAGNQRVAMAHLTPQKHESEEYHLAVEILREVENKP